MNQMYLSSSHFGSGMSGGFKPILGEVSKMKGARLNTNINRTGAGIETLKV